MLYARRKFTGALAAAALLSAPIAVSAPASAAAVASCTIAGAAPVPLGVATTYNASDCSNAGQGYTHWETLTATAGSVITIDVQAAALSQALVFAPGTTDFTLTTTAQRFCAINVVGFAELKCQVTSTGTWLVGLGDGFSSTTDTATVTLASAKAVAGQVNPSCTISGAPTAPSRVRQYSDGVTCSAVHDSRQFWKVRLYAGDRVGLYGGILIGQSNGGYVKMYPPSVTDFTLDASSSYCSLFVLSTSTSAPCPVVTRAGLYTLDADRAFFLFPVINHLVKNTLSKSARVKHKATYTVIDKLTSPAGTPAATCVLQVRVGTKWRTLRAGLAVRGRCTLKVSWKTKGVRILRVNVVGKTGWLNSTTPAFKVTVT
jgi:hypothetical protein